MLMPLFCSPISLSTEQAPLESIDIRKGSSLHRRGQAALSTVVEHGQSGIRGLESGGSNLQARGGSQRSNPAKSSPLGRKRRPRRQQRGGRAREARDGASKYHSELM